ncbi:MAG: hypothetical protein CL910_04120 [Deltaproteobacteria bacterium]|jgi:cation transport regulator ChaC|nr:hypothetical protein [Deltaproteobacteria bacterium]
MDPRTFLGRRKMRPLHVQVARLDDHALRFDLPVGKGERAVANVTPLRGEHVWGVAYEIEGRQASQLDRTEGVHVGAYLRRAIELRAKDGSRFGAFTYCSSRGVPGRKPSRRYMGLLLHGARHHGLPDDYVTWLRSLELAPDERWGQRELF